MKFTEVKKEKTEEKDKDNVDAVPPTSVYTQTYACA